jgi:DNA excision repair protein ERCC-3
MSNKDIGVDDVVVDDVDDEEEQQRKRQRTTRSSSSPSQTVIRVPTQNWEDAFDEEEQEHAADEQEYLPATLKLKLSRPKAVTASKGKGKTKQRARKRKQKEKEIEIDDGDGEEEENKVAQLFGKCDFSTLVRVNAGKKSKAVALTNRPLWVCPDGRIFLETFSPNYRHAYDFLIAIAEPVCRPQLLHEYQLTDYSLYAAVSVGLQTKDILGALSRLSKCEIPDSVKQWISDCTLSYGKVKLILQRNRYFVESQDPDVLKRLLQEDVIRNARVHHRPQQQEEEEREYGDGEARNGNASSSSSSSTMTDDDIGVYDLATGLYSAPRPEAIQLPSMAVDFENMSADLSAAIDDDNDDSNNNDDKNDGSSAMTSRSVDGERVHSFEIGIEHVAEVKKRCIEVDFPMLEEYDFRNDAVNPTLDIDLKPTTSIRPYQERSLSKMFGNGRARSGIIVLPCGAGKTLVGITAACTIKKSVLVLCTSSVSVDQWRYQFKLWSTIKDENISRFTSDMKEPGVEPSVTITTYTMVAFGGRRSEQAKLVMAELQRREWGLMLLDEVHVVPANMFRKVITVTAAHCKLGLTATLVREDEKIGHLNFLIGPKLYEANWLDLIRAGHLARVQCAEVWCPMTPEFYREYLTAPTATKRKMLCIMNPNKVQATEFLVKYHEARGDKILVFSDDVYALKKIANKLGKEYIYGPTRQRDRLRILSQFLYNPNCRTIFISKVGDTSIDLPEASVLIQISSHFGSRRQEAQRLGRILRPKQRQNAESHQANAYFYTLVSNDTQEVFYSAKRQQFLIDQGYTFKIITQLPTHDRSIVDSLSYTTKPEQLRLLADIMSADANEERLDDFDDITVSSRRNNRSLSSLSGANGRSYLEFRHPIISRLKAKKKSRLQKH